MEMNRDMIRLWNCVFGIVMLHRLGGQLEILINDIQSTDINPGYAMHRANRTQVHAGSGSMPGRESGEVSCAICGTDNDTWRTCRASCPFYAQPTQTYMKPYLESLPIGTIC